MKLFVNDDDDDDDDIACNSYCNLLLFILCNIGLPNKMQIRKLHKLYCNVSVNARLGLVTWTSRSRTSRDAGYLWNFSVLETCNITRVLCPMLSTNRPNTNSFILCKKIMFYTRITAARGPISPWICHCSPLRPTSWIILRRKCVLAHC